MRHLLSLVKGGLGLVFRAGIERGLVFEDVEGALLKVLVQASLLSKLLTLVEAEVAVDLRALASQFACDGRAQVVC